MGGESSGALPRPEPVQHLAGDLEVADHVVMAAKAAELALDAIGPHLLGRSFQKGRAVRKIRGGGVEGFQGFFDALGGGTHGRGALGQDLVGQNGVAAVLRMRHPGWNFDGHGLGTNSQQSPSNPSKVETQPTGVSGWAAQPEIEEGRPTPICVCSMNPVAKFSNRKLL